VAELDIYKQEAISLMKMMRSWGEFYKRQLEPFGDNLWVFEDMSDMIHMHLDPYTARLRQIGMPKSDLEPIHLTIQIIFQQMNNHVRRMEEALSPPVSLWL
jgi:hypothetical protein